jgi:hypothetical protein
LRPTAPFSSQYAKAIVIEIGLHFDIDVSCRWFAMQSCEELQPSDFVKTNPGGQHFEDIEWSR